MSTKIKNFDCVEMKNRIQAECMAEYEAKKSEYANFEDFVRARTGRSEWVKNMREKFHIEEAR